MSGGESDGNDAELRARLDALAGRLSDRRNDPAAADGDRPDDGGRGRALGQGMRVVGELVGAIGVGGFIGWELDRWLGTAPAMLMVFLGLGTAAAFLNLYRMGSSRPPGRDGT